MVIGEFKVTTRKEKSPVFPMVAYFCHHLSDNYVDLSELKLVFFRSDLYFDLSDLYYDLILSFHQYGGIFLPSLIR